MKIELDIPIKEFNCYYDSYDEYGEYGEDIKVNTARSFIDIIVDKAAEKLLADICDSYENDIYKILSDKINHVKQTIEQKMTNELSKDAYAEIRDKVTEKVIENTVDKYERSYQYRDIKKKLEIESDSAITTGMRNLISDIVRTEVKKIIKL
jgi:hypothetical protein